MKFSKTMAAVAGVGLVAAGLLTAAPASADPSGPDSPYSGRPLQGVGSDTTQNVMSDLANVVTISGAKQLASWDAVGGSATFQTRASAACTYTRTEANGSGAGRSRLLESLQTLNARSGCLDFSRSSSARGTTVTTPSLTWIPFAKDASTYVVRADGTSPRNLPLADVITAYKCGFPADPANGDPGIIPVLPQTGSGSRAFWLTVIGVSEAQITSTYPCLRGLGTAASPAYEQENDSRNLLPNQIAPFSIGLFNVQAAGVNADNRGNTVMAQIGGTLPVASSTVFPVSRDLFNVVPTAKLAVAPTSTVFVGPTSLICSNPTTIAANGFAPLTASSTPVCGDTSSQS